MCLAKVSGDMHTVGVSVVALAEDHSVEWSVKDDPHSHHVFLALDLEVLDLGHVGRLGDLPGVVGAGGRWGWGWGPGR